MELSSCLRQAAILVEDVACRIEGASPAELAKVQTHLGEGIVGALSAAGDEAALEAAGAHAVKVSPDVFSRLSFSSIFLLCFSLFCSFRVFFFSFDFLARAVPSRKFISRFLKIQNCEFRRHWYAHSDGCSFHDFVSHHDDWDFDPACY